MALDRDIFFDYVRPLFGGHMAQTQVDGTSAILDAWDKWVPDNLDLNPNLACQAYVLATPTWETAHTMQPIAEYGKGVGKAYGVPHPGNGLVYYGRGYPQLTWYANYELQGTRLGVDLVGNPDLMLQPDISANVLIDGMFKGAFTTRRLGQYFSGLPSHYDPFNARRVINGVDRATTIAQYYRVYLTALTRATTK